MTIGAYLGFTPAAQAGHPLVHPGHRHLPIVFLALHFSSPGDPGNANGPMIPNYVQPKRSPFTGG